MVGTYLVLCREDRKSDGTLGQYVLATRRGFPTLAEAIEYARSISPSREPVVVQTVWARTG